jgi:hypothetical protein
MLDCGASVGGAAMFESGKLFAVDETSVDAVLGMG